MLDEGRAVMFAWEAHSLLSVRCFSGFKRNTRMCLSENQYDLSLLEGIQSRRQGSLQHFTVVILACVFEELVEHLLLYIH